VLGIDDELFEVEAGRIGSGDAIRGEERGEGYSKKLKW